VSEKNEKLHKLFVKFNVKAVFSGSEKDYIIKSKDSIKYVNAGCNASTDKKNKKNSRFYIVNFTDNDLNIEPVK